MLSPGHPCLRLCLKQMMEVVACELVFHATMGDAAIACTSPAARSTGGDGGNDADAITARRFCDEAVVQVKCPASSPINGQVWRDG